MNRTFMSLLLVAAFAVPAMVRAEDGDKQSWEGHKHHDRAEWMKKKLGLSDDQAKKIETAREDHRKASEPLRADLKKAVRKVEGQLLIEGSEKDIAAALDQAEKARAALRAENEKFMASMKSILTPTQRAKALVFRAKMMHGRMAWRGHGDRGHEDRDGGHEKHDDHDGD
jgi:Spy/CpxP family protein refolding chaperone